MSCYCALVKQLSWCNLLSCFMSVVCFFCVKNDYVKCVMLLPWPGLLCKTQRYKCERESSTVQQDQHCFEVDTKWTPHYLNLQETNSEGTVQDGKTKFKVLFLEQKMLQLLLPFSHKYILIYVDMKDLYADGFTTQFYIIAYFILGWSDLMLFEAVLPDI